MNIEPIIFFDMVVTIFILAVILVIIIFYLARLTKALHVNPNDKDEVSQKTANMLDTARIRAIKIIDDANNQALDIVSKVTLSADDTSENFKENLSQAASNQIKEFEKATADFTKVYSQILQDLKTKNIEVFQGISKDIEVNTMQEVSSFKESMRKLTASSQEEVRKKIEADYEAVKKEIENYRQKELGKIDSKIYEFLEKMSKLVLGKALNLSEHEDLIEESLLKAKQEGAFK